MKRLILIVLIFFTGMILLPTCIVLCIPAKRTENRESSSPLVTVLFTERGKTENICIEEYLPGVVAAEMPASFHEEALRAQAVAARTFIYNHIVSGEKNEDHPDAHVCTDSAHCKAWLSDEALVSRHGEDWKKTFYPKIQSAVETTKGEILTFMDAPIVAVFHSTGSGRTENAKDVWGGDLPYLQSVESPGDAFSPKFTSSVEISKSDFMKALEIAEIHLGEYKRSEGGGVLELTIGEKQFTGRDLRERFGLNSTNFEIEETESSVVFHVKGNGHGVGLSQYGANYMAENGSTYDQILSQYYTGVSLCKQW